ncbi:hypothetical protein SDC9_169271 [bioreactor metagenome]|uniref:Uncharacterized protein n=1 Tax=bioreactor metagenome TaxID=1076179 RepID=A0A645G7X2_9ZZZZ
MVTREDDSLFDLCLACLGVLFFLFFYENKALDKQDDFLFRPNLLPHIGDINAVLIVRVALADRIWLVGRLRHTDVKRQESRVDPAQGRTKVDLV